MDNINYTISTNDKYGICIEFENTDISDEFEDFITERLYVLFDTVFSDSKTIFYFGQAGCAEEVKKIAEAFIKSLE